MANEINPTGTVSAQDEIVARIRDDLPGDEILYDLAELYKVFGDFTRVKILCALLAAELRVCDISAALGMSQSAISHQLRSLKQSKLVKYRRDGKAVLYSLADAHVRTMVDQGMEHILE